MNNIVSIGNNCVGCRSCEQVCPAKCISMKPNKEGFLYPVVDDNSCLDCGLCIKKCPSSDDNKISTSQLSSIGFKGKDNDLVYNSASGGVCAIATKVILNNGGVVFGAVYDDNLVVKHIMVDSLEDFSKLQTSKYVQSDVNNTYSEVKAQLESGRLVLYTGTPCQIAGLSYFLGKKYDNLYTIDLICHGVPSPKLFAKYINYQAKKLNSKVTGYNFRYKGKNGWGCKDCLIVTPNKKVSKPLAFDKYFINFNAGNCYRESCYNCKYANLNRPADVTTGDFWGILKCHPDFNSDNGVSSILINNAHGQELINMMSEYAEVINVSIEDVLIKQGNLIHSTPRPEIRDTFYDSIDSEDFIDNIKVGLRLKERIKYIIPRKVANFLKK